MKWCKNQKRQAADINAKILKILIQKRQAAYINERILKG